ncbi:MAG TPA: hypothetical protein VF472_03055 [Burkholderiaceae bacterium]
MSRRCFALLFAFLLSALPLLGLAAPAPACAHCPSTASVQKTHCHQQAAKLEQCHHCASCAACAYPPAFHARSPAVVQFDGAVESHATYLAAHFYRLTSPPLDRPPSFFPA